MVILLIIRLFAAWTTLQVIGSSIFALTSNSVIAWCVTTTDGSTELQAQLPQEVTDTQSFIDSGRPLHLVGTYDGTTMKVYVGGRLIDSVPKTGNLAITPNIPLYIGRTNYGYYYKGNLAGFAWYPTALDDDTIMQHAKASGLAF